MEVIFPEKVGFLSEPHRYKVLYGGRGGIKSWSIGQHLLIAGRKVKKLKLLEFTGGCRMSGQFTKVGLNGT